MRRSDLDLLLEKYTKAVDSYNLNGIKEGAPLYRFSIAQPDSPLTRAVNTALTVMNNLTATHAVVFCFGEFK